MMLTLLSWLLNSEWRRSVSQDRIENHCEKYWFWWRTLIKYEIYSRHWVHFESTLKRNFHCLKCNARSWHWKWIRCQHLSLRSEKIQWYKRTLCTTSTRLIYLKWCYQQKRSLINCILTWSISLISRRNSENHMHENSQYVHALNNLHNSIKSLCFLWMSFTLNAQTIIVNVMMQLIYLIWNVSFALKKITSRMHVFLKSFYWRFKDLLRDERFWKICSSL